MDGFGTTAFGIGIAAIIFIALIILILWAVLCMVPAIMAEKRGRNKLGWFLVSFFFNPILGIFCLFCLGETEEKREERILSEEELRESVRRKNTHQESEQTEEKRSFNPSAKTIGDMYRR